MGKSEANFVWTLILNAEKVSASHTSPDKRFQKVNYVDGKKCDDGT